MIYKEFIIIKSESLILIKQFRYIAYRFPVALLCMSALHLSEVSTLSNFLSELGLTIANTVSPTDKWLRLFLLNKTGPHRPPTKTPALGQANSSHATAQPQASA
jgi:hypothetical protein